MALIDLTPEAGLQSGEGLGISVTFVDAVGDPFPVSLPDVDVRIKDGAGATFTSDDDFNIVLGGGVGEVELAWEAVVAGRHYVRAEWSAPPAFASVDGFFDVDPDPTRPPDPNLASLMRRLRRRVRQMELRGEAATDDVWEASGLAAMPPSFFERHLLDAACHVAAVAARSKPHLLGDLVAEGPPSAVAGSLATLSANLRVQGGAARAAEPVTLRGAIQRPRPAMYVEEDGRAFEVTARSASILARVANAPASVQDLPASLQDAVVEEAAAAVFMAIGGDGPQAWGRANESLQAVL